MKRFLLVGSLVVIVASQSSCGTIAGNFITPCMWGSCCGEKKTRIYGGVRLHAEGLSQLSPERIRLTQMSTWELMWHWIVALIDMPLCFVLDTLTLPITVPIELSR